MTKIIFQIIFIFFLLSIGSISFVSAQQSDNIIPPWFAQPVKWWGQNLISDQEFGSSLEHLIKTKVITSPSFVIIEPEEPIIEYREGSSETTVRNVSPVPTSSLPTFFKNNAIWWAEGKITDSDLILGIENLIENEIIVTPNIKILTPCPVKLDKPSLDLTGNFILGSFIQFAFGEKPCEGADFFDHDHVSSSKVKRGDTFTVDMLMYERGFTDDANKKVDYLLTYKIPQGTSYVDHRDLGSINNSDLIIPMDYCEFDDSNNEIKCTWSHPQKEQSAMLSVDLKVDQNKNFNSIHHLAKLEIIDQNDLPTPHTFQKWDGPTLDATDLILELQDQNQKVPLGGTFEFRTYVLNEGSKAENSILKIVMPYTMRLMDVEIIHSDGLKLTKVSDKACNFVSDYGETIVCNMGTFESGDEILYNIFVHVKENTTPGNDSIYIYTRSDSIIKSPANGQGILNVTISKGPQSFKVIGSYPEYYQNAAIRYNWILVNSSGNFLEQGAAINLIEKDGIFSNTSEVGENGKLSWLWGIASGGEATLNMSISKNQGKTSSYDGDGDTIYGSWPPDPFWQKEFPALNAKIVHVDECFAKSLGVGGGQLSWHFAYSNGTSLEQGTPIHMIWDNGYKDQMIIDKDGKVIVDIIPPPGAPDKGTLSVSHFLWTPHIYEGDGDKLDFDVYNKDWVPGTCK